MALTPNYSFIVPTGTDAVNLLTQCYPNFTSLDGILVPIEENGVTPATHTLVGTVHQIVRTKSMCNMFRFVATANYASGDTFTVDGVSVTATAVNGTSLPAGAFVINQSVVAVVNGTVLTVLVPGTITIPTPTASGTSYDNTVSGLVATDVQDAIDELQSEISNIPTPPEHGIYELWSNANPTSNFNAQAISFDYDSTHYDGFIVAFEERTSDVEGATWKEYDNFVLSNPSFTGTLTFSSMDIGTGKMTVNYRTFTTSLVGTTLTLTFASNKLSTVNSYGSGGTLPTDENSKIIPVRVLGIAHNS